MNTAASPKAFRLPSHVRPDAYDIDLHASLAREGFHGAVTIDLTIAESDASLTLHARELELSDAALTLPGGEVLRDLPIRLDALRQTATFTLPRPVQGAARLSVRFAGVLNPGMHGLYLASDGHARAVCSQCQATDARGIFPCFDEPEFKASLRWRITTDQRDPAGVPIVALCNGVLQERSDVADQHSFRYAATRKVSSYLAAVALGTFDHSDEILVNGVPLKVYAPHGKGAQTRFANEFTARLLPWYEDYFGYPFPYGKYDQVAVPGFDAGAMENVGLVLFRQSLLLMDPATASWRNEKLIALVVAHEFAHMWFGNLVTMQWWDDLWLNEAFAEWMAHKAVAVAAPSYLVWNDFQDDKNRALIDDALPSTHPIWTPVATPEEAVELFDTITYQKGCATMRMLENFLGEETFRAGLRSYMQTYAEKNATGPDLWRALAQASGLPVGELMHSWVAQPGFPLITMELIEGEERLLRVSQRRFFSDPVAQAADNDQLWRVPLVLRYVDADGVHEHRHILSEREGQVRLPGRGPLVVLHGNADEVGFYRVRYVGALQEALVREGAARLSAVEQMGLIEDTWALVRSAQVEIGAFVAVLGGFADTRDHNVLRAVTDRLGTLDLLLRDSGERAARLQLRAFIARRFHGHLQELGYHVPAGEAQNEIQRRSLYVYALAGLARVPEVIAEAERLAELERADPRAIDANLAGTFVALAAKFGDEARYQDFVATYQKRKGEGAAPQESARYLYTLTGYRRPGLAERTLQLIDEGVVPQEAVGAVLVQLLHSRHAQEVAWGYLRRSWATLQKRVGDMGQSRLVEAVGGLPAAWRADIVAFFAENPPTTAARALQRALVNLDQREELRRRVLPGLLAALADL